MDAKQDTSSNGQESSGIDNQSESDNTDTTVDWEAIARRELTVTMDKECRQQIEEPWRAIESAVEHGRDAGEAFDKARQSTLAHEQRTRNLLADIGEVDAGEPRQRLVARLLDVAHSVLAPYVDDERVVSYTRELERCFEDFREEIGADAAKESAVSSKGDVTERDVETTNR